MRILRTIVILANIGYLIFFVWLAVDEGFDGMNQALSLLGLSFTLALNIYFIAPNKWGGDSWFGLFLKRKALEEKKRIEDLENKKQ